MAWSSRGCFAVLSIRPSQHRGWRCESLRDYESVRVRIVQMDYACRGRAEDASLRSALDLSQYVQHRRQILERDVAHVPDAERVRLPLPIAAAEGVAAGLHGVANLFGITNRFERRHGRGGVVAIGCQLRESRGPLDG